MLLRGQNMKVENANFKYRQARIYKSSGKKFSNNSIKCECQKSHTGRPKSEIQWAGTTKLVLIKMMFGKSWIECLCRRGILNLMAHWVKNLPSVQEIQETQVQHWVRTIPWRRKWQPTPVFLPGKSNGQRSLGGHSPKGPKDMEATEHAQVGGARTFLPPLFISPCSSWPTSGIFVNWPVPRACVFISLSWSGFLGPQNNICCDRSMQEKKKTC